MPAPVRNRGHRLAAYRRCSADLRCWRAIDSGIVARDRDGGEGNVSAELVFTLVYGGAGLLLLSVIILSRRAKRHGGSYRAGVVGAVYEWQNKDKQRALDAIVEGRAAETRPEYPDGDLPQLEHPAEVPADQAGNDGQPEGSESAWGSSENGSERGRRTRR